MGDYFRLFLIPLRYRKRCVLYMLLSTVSVLVLLCLDVPDSQEPIANHNIANDKEITSTKNASIQLQHKLAVLVPYRDRREELLIFVPELSRFLERENVIFKIFLLNQTDPFRFNRAVLINIGFLLSKAEGFDYIAMHDVDLLPVDNRLSYSFPEKWVAHLSAPHLHPLYHYKTYVGGILLIKHVDFERINGMSNRYWGWGLEDDEFYTRLKRANFSLLRPAFNSSNAFKHIHDRKKRKRDFRAKIPSLLKVDRKTGVSTLDSDGENGQLKCEMPGIPASEDVNPQTPLQAGGYGNVNSNSSNNQTNVSSEEPPPPYSACFSEEAPPAYGDINPRWKLPDVVATSSRLPFAGISSTRPLLPPVSVVVDQQRGPVNTPQNIQLIMVPRAENRDEQERRRLKNIALPLAILSLFFGSLFCAIPALFWACRPQAPIMDYRKSILFSTTALLISVAAVVFTAVKTNRVWEAGFDNN